MALPAQIKKQVKKAKKIHDEVYSNEQAENSDPAAEQTPPPGAEGQPLAQVGDVAEAPVEGDGNPDEPAAVPDGAAASAEGQTAGDEVPTDGQGEEVDPREDDPEFWKHKYSVLEGKYRAEVPRLHDQNRELHEQLNRVEQLLASMSPPEVNAPAPVETPRLTEDDVEAWGSDMVDFVKRAAAEMVAEQIQPLREENDQLKAMLGQVSSTAKETAREAMLRQLAAQVPDWEAQNVDPGFLAWLNEPDIYSGVSRRQLLTDAFEQNHTARVVALFKGYQAENQPTATPSAPQTVEQETPPQPVVNMDSLVAPGKPSQASGDAEQGSAKYFTQQEISAFYADVRSGKYRKRPELRQQIEQEIFDAVNAGRVTP